MEPFKKFKKFEMAIDCILFIDIIMTFIKAYKKKGKIIQSPKKIAKAYL